MFARGLVEETRRLLPQGLAENQTAMQAIGYRQVVEHLRGERGLAETIELLKIRAPARGTRSAGGAQSRLPKRCAGLRSDRHRCRPSRQAGDARVGFAAFVDTSGPLDGDGCKRIMART